MNYDLITILGPTASGKTTLAANLAYQINGEIISADSRQVYKGMDLGTGKDYEDYLVNGNTIPYHIIDIKEAGYKYNVYEYQKDFLNAYEDIKNRNKVPVLCGGTGLYIEAAVKGYKLIQVPVNEPLRTELEKLTLGQLIEKLKTYKLLHATSDITTTKHAIRAIEIEVYYKDHPEIEFHYPKINSLFIGVKYDRQVERERITLRLQQRIDLGMIEEVKKLLAKGLNPEQLIFYGLEYKYLTLFIIGKISYDEMFIKLNTAIHQFAKRQMTWFRRMERNGIEIHWLEGDMPLQEKINRIKSLL
ncbi:MAG: tRNA (adenosine(37)-N6)-dimethylallyltransferase MiaA [Bacteroidota bacterium]|nr:tRNA (adenosine(37)-N6)-dimethylallyltransferase MiaA [Bacteroidota bacterium]MDP4226487.1 tRNA (adenosine(37)-N6)-dimethylallyltransferase MiaA [Bacteroidota bacterium]